MRDGMPVAPFVGAALFMMHSSFSAASSSWMMTPPPLRQQPAHDFPPHVRQPKVAAGVAVRQAFVVEAQQEQHGGVQVVNVVPHRTSSL
jgi:hypothetical protein